ncbi:hypothetical protein F9874_05545 [Glaesserella parasuis]|uniref:hypothetical protein n=1 Tax=Glaesserella parasuis TaxID=738 RepID=UPI001324B1C3|nr:hypothetical protein [Glaesserella parasuis]MWP99729.1 hypothetical protein [Glaesserella parasuis]MWQ45061.1 hypothetical protein [Glaesserella parasuis]MWQ61614.1 hypothetical protein [Glaesserella parasuis]
MKKLIVSLSLFYSQYVLARPGVECALNPNCGFGNLFGTVLLLVIIFGIAFIWDKIKNLFK